ncbi:MAG: Lsm family RNA-binding protein [Candidatus Thorarchaeota archaeon]|jgi:small nuclear ribonucleoprotein (snRNP)-like protein
MSDVAAMRAFNRELAAVVGATVEVVINTGKTFSGILKGIDQTSLSIVLSDVIADGETSIPKIFLYGSSIVSFSVAEREVSLEGLAKELERTFPPGGVQFYPDTGIILVMNKIRISKDGIEGSGPLYERVAVIADDWLKEHGLAE